MTKLPKVEPVMLRMQVPGLPPMELRALTRGEVSVMMTEVTFEAQDKIMREVLGGTEEAAVWLANLPQTVAVELIGELIHQSCDIARPKEVARVGESSGVVPTSVSDSQSHANSG